MRGSRRFWGFNPRGEFRWRSLNNWSKRSITDVGRRDVTLSAVLLEKQIVCGCHVIVFIRSNAFPSVIKINPVWLQLLNNNFIDLNNSEFIVTVFRLLGCRGTRQWVLQFPAWPQISCTTGDCGFCQWCNAFQDLYSRSFSLSHVLSFAQSSGSWNHRPEFSYTTP